MLGNIPTALAVCTEGLSFEPDDAELLFRKAILHRKAGQPGDAETCWRKILTLKRPEQFCSVDQGIYGHLTLRNLAVLAAERGDRAEVERLWHAVLAECPGDREAEEMLERMQMGSSPTIASQRRRANNHPRAASSRSRQVRRLPADRRPCQSKGENHSRPRNRTIASPSRDAPAPPITACDGSGF